VKRSTPLKRTTSLRRQVPVRRRNAKRAAKRFDDSFGEQADRCRRGFCVACVLLCQRQTTPTVPHHDPCRPRGKDRDTVGLCRDHHTDGPRAVHRLGRETFWRIVGIEFAEVVEWMRRGDVIDVAWVKRWHRNDLPVDLSLGEAESFR